MQGRLVLFDIDGTLLDTRGAGLHAIRKAIRQIHGGEGPELNLGGATDSSLARQILGHFGVEPDEEAVRFFYATYLEYLGEHLQGDDYEGVVFPGVRELLDELRNAGATLGLLTGNIADGAALKIDHFGLSGYFTFGAYGDDHHDRNELGPIALRRAHHAHGTLFTGGRTVIVGDTPRDIDCGRAIGALTLCVATGSFGADELRAHGADLVVEQFGAPEPLVAHLRRAIDESELP